MTTKDKILGLFETNRDVYFSGEDIAKEFSISRAAVWKAVNSLKSEGYDINALTNKGYCMPSDVDILSSQGICKYLENDMDIQVFQKVSSTNTLLREKANEGAREGFTIIANEQESGRGRLGRNFFSPSGSGIYMSLLLRPTNCTSNSAIRITTIAAVALCEAIESVSDKKAEIKWVNDIFIDNKKVCGILTEGSFGLENGLLEYAILGIGINVFKPTGGFPSEIDEIAGSIFDSPKEDIKNHLVAEFLNRFMNYYKYIGNTNYVAKYRERNFVIGKEIKVVHFGTDETRHAEALGLDDDCRLLVQYDDGEQEYLSSGEISIRF